MKVFFYLCRRMVNKKKVLEDDENYEGSTKRKTPQQLQTLENLYSGNKISLNTHFLSLSNDSCSWD